jgi:hypothetical protein
MMGRNTRRVVDIPAKRDATAYAQQALREMPVRKAYLDHRD